MTQFVDRRDLEFQLFDVLGVDQLARHDRFGGYDRQTVTAALDTAEAIAREHYLSCAAALDAEEPRFENGQARTHPSTKPALRAFAEAGFFATGAASELGGLQAPAVVQTAINGMFSAANLSIHNYAMLTLAASNLLAAFGSDEQKHRYLPAMLEGRWFGTMCLSEPDAGSSLADIKTRAVPQDDGTHAISGTKMWISGGDQDISENIVHMVLAKRPDAPPGVGGISLFIVPKYRVMPDGSIGDWNHVSLAGLNHKMGNRGTTNTLLNFGETGVCQGWLVGEPHHGLRYMFHMMNEARIAVGHGATMQGLAGYLHSLEYARTRTQGRAASSKGLDAPQQPIIQHADIKRLLLFQKASVEGALGLILYCASLVDRLAIATGDAERRDVNTLLSLLTPIAKSWPSEFCLEANKHAIQVLGGAGYTRDHPVERLYRDNRLNPIHEGTHGIQALDLLGRKLRQDDGAAFERLAAEIEATLDQAATAGELNEFTLALSDAMTDLKSTIDVLLACPDVEIRLANATPFLDAFGHVVIAWMWLRQCVAIRSQPAADQDSGFARGKLRAAAYFFRYELPVTKSKFALTRSLDTTCLDAEAVEF
jgi:alkylation response protein AidB-like acyl-CoA dehydrogenase